MSKGSGVAWQSEIRYELWHQHSPAGRTAGQEVSGSRRVVLTRRPLSAGQRKGSTGSGRPADSINSSPGKNGKNGHMFAVLAGRLTNSFCFHWRGENYRRGMEILTKFSLAPSKWAGFRPTGAHSKSHVIARARADRCPEISWWWLNGLEGIISSARRDSHVTIGELRPGCRSDGDPF